MLRITLEQWRMFRSVAEFGGFNQASQGIHKSQSSIHHAVQKIEQSLDVKLLYVEGRKTRLTEAGELMLRRAKYLLDEAEKVESVAQTLAEGIESQLRIAVDEVFPQALLYKVLTSVSLQYPMLRIELMESILSGANELLKKREVDIAISTFVMPDVYSEELCQIEFLAVASPNHVLHLMDRELTLEDLKAHTQIVVRDSARSDRQDIGWLGANQRWTVSHMQTSIDIISKGLGFSWLPVSSIQKELNNGSLKALQLAHNGKRSSQLHLLFTDGDRLGPAARDFIGELRFQCMSLHAAEKQ